MQVNLNSIVVIPKILDTFQQFLVAIIADEIVKPGNFEQCQPHLSACCENRQLNYFTLESNLRLFFALLHDYNQSLDQDLYAFLKLQAFNCLLDEHAFALLPIALPDENCLSNADLVGLHCSSNHCGMVGSHLIGL